MPHDTVYLIYSSDFSIKAALSQEEAAEWARGHYSYPIPIIGVPLVGALPEASKPVRPSPVLPYRVGITLDEALTGIRFAHTRRLYWRIYDIADFPISDTYLANLIGEQSRSSVRSRRAELTRAGWLVEVEPLEQFRGRRLRQYQARYPKAVD